jgi:hypothetical protein
MNLLKFLKPRPAKTHIDSYGQRISISHEIIQSIMEWLFASLMAAGYLGKSHIIWFDSDQRY